MASLTGLGRPEWAKIRRKFLRTGVNKESLDIVESSIFFVTKFKFIILKTNFNEAPDNNRIFYRFRSKK